MTTVYISGQPDNHDYDFHNGAVILRVPPKPNDMRIAERVGPGEYVGFYKVLDTRIVVNLPSGTIGIITGSLFRPQIVTGIEHIVLEYKNPPEYHPAPHTECARMYIVRAAADITFHMGLPIGLQWSDLPADVRAGICG
jgi:hypothetical protein